MNACPHCANLKKRESFIYYLKTEIFKSLDGLRALAIIAVVWHHTGPVIQNWPITTRGFLGVDLFFIISGFLIVTLLLRELTRKNKVSLRNFYIRRFLRIFPAYYLMLLVVGVTAFLKSGNTATTIMHELPFAAFYLSNFFQMNSMLHITWSLSAEEQFYLVIPTVIKYARRILPHAIIIAYVLATLPTFGFFPSASLPSFFRETTFGPILLGVMLAYTLNNIHGFTWTSKALGWRYAPIFSLTLVFALLSYPNDDISGWHRIGIHWAMLALLASCVVRENHALQPVLTLQSIQRIGRVSYGIYLYHLIVAHFIQLGIKVINIGGVPTLFAGTIVATWAIAELSYRYYEAPFLAMKAKFRSGNTKLRT